MNARVLIADDEPAIVMGLEFLFRQEAFEVETVADGGAVLAHALRFNPDLIVLDVMLPNRSGFDVCRDLRADLRTASMHIVMLTAKGRPAEREAGLDAGADAYVTKPFGTRDLVRIVRSLLQR